MRSSPTLTEDDPGVQEIEASIDLLGLDMSSASEPPAQQEQGDLASPGIQNLLGLSMASNGESKRNESPSETTDLLGL